jgi:hypothetical protein
MLKLPKPLLFYFQAVEAVANDFGVKNRKG